MTNNHKKKARQIERLIAELSGKQKKEKKRNFDKD